MGLSQRELAARINTRQSLIARLEAGQRALSLLEFLALCAALDLEPAETIFRLLGSFPEGSLSSAFPPPDQPTNGRN